VLLEQVHQDHKRAEARNRLLEIELRRLDSEVQAEVSAGFFGHAVSEISGGATPPGPAWLPGRSISDGSGVSNGISSAVSNDVSKSVSNGISNAISNGHHSGGVEAGGICLPRPLPKALPKVLPAAPPPPPPKLVVPADGTLAEALEALEKKPPPSSAMGDKVAAAADDAGAAGFQSGVLGSTSELGLRALLQVASLESQIPGGSGSAPCFGQDATGPSVNGASEMLRAAARAPDTLPLAHGKTAEAWKERLAQFGRASASCDPGVSAGGVRM